MVGVGLNQHDDGWLAHKYYDEIRAEHIERVKAYQSAMASRIVSHDAMDVNSVRYVVGVDVAYSADVAFAAAVMMDTLDGRIVHVSNGICRVHIPYIPGLLFLREAAPMLSALGRLDRSTHAGGRCHYPYMVIVDGNGMLHPRFFGLACYIGLLVDRPTIGVSKSLLCGRVSGGKVTIGDREVGRVVECYGSRRRVYVSIGHKISLDSAERVVRSLISAGRGSPSPSPSRSRSRSRSRSMLPEPLGLAHDAANALRRSQARP
ncbi:MAG: endonuclease V [Candidatus Nitrosocaldus sp.]|nr:endonuclease V [Candidatus Nitrosocaldus sp.]